MPESEILTCSLSLWEGDLKRCRWCNAELRGRQERWSSQWCVQAFAATHWPGDAARLTWAAGECVRCGRGPRGLRIAAAIFGPPRPAGPYPIGWHDWMWTGTTPADGDPAWVAYTNALLDLSAAERHVALEANHIRPVRGVRASGCWNHPDNLEALCHDCHAQESRLQIVSARGRRPGMATIACWEGLHERCWAWEANRACNCGCHPWSDEIRADELDPTRGVQGSLEVSA